MPFSPQLQFPGLPKNGEVVDSTNNSECQDFFPHFLHVFSDSLDNLREKMKLALISKLQQTNLCKTAH